MDDADVFSLRSAEGSAERSARSAVARPDRVANPIGIAFGLIIADALLIGSIATIVVRRVDVSLASDGLSLAHSVLIIAGAVLGAVLSLWRSGAYAIDGATPSSASIANAWLNASGLLAFALWMIGSPFTNSWAASTQLSLIEFTVLGGIAVLSRNALWLRLKSNSTLVFDTAVLVGAESLGVSGFTRQLREKCPTIKLVGVFSELDSEADEIVRLVRAGAVRIVYIIVPAAEPEKADALIAKLLPLSVAVRLVPDIAPVLARSCAVSLQAGTPVFHVYEPPLGRAGAFVKRLEDIIAASLLLLLAAPVMLLAGIAIRLTSPGPALFRQLRHGFNGAEIEVFKFRTMYTELEDRMAARQTVRGDDRVTPVGAFLRRHSLDELPQLFNVLAGTMSLVGPRAHPLVMSADGQLLEQAINGYMARLRLKPGITGWAQVCGCRGNIDSLEKGKRRVQHDLFYIENWSLIFDLEIIFRTIRIIFFDHEAF